MGVASYVLYTVVCESNDAAREIALIISEVCLSIVAILKAVKVNRKAYIDARWRAGMLPFDTDYIDIDFRYLEYSLEYYLEYSLEYSAL